jgi:hypothetical protein
VREWHFCETYVPADDSASVHAAVLDRDGGVVWQCSHRHRLNDRGQSRPAKQCAYTALLRLEAALVASPAVRPAPTEEAND